MTKLGVCESVEAAKVMAQELANEEGKTIYINESQPRDIVTKFGKQRRTSHVVWMSTSVGEKTVARVNPA